jgi:hypothetical protein
MAIKSIERMKMISIKLFTILIWLGVLLVSVTADAETLVQKWKQGLSRAKLTSFSGSVVSSNSTLTVVSFCGDGRYSYYKEGSWSVPGTAGGASNNTITGRWDIQQNGSQVMLIYAADNGQQGSFPIYLQNNGRVNIGGTAFAIQQGGAGC